MRWTWSGVLDLIFYAAWLAGSVWFLVASGRNPDRSAKREPFRKPARLLGWGSVALSASAVLVELLAQITAHLMLPRLQNKLWMVVLAIFALGSALVWKGTRDARRAADAYPPGKHASPDRRRIGLRRLRG
jgi:hypothetical protein